jgi:hypothetical protein
VAIAASSPPPSRSGLNDEGQIVGAYENPAATPNPQQEGGSPPLDTPALLEVEAAG